jgi:hypothetical protein
MAGKPNDSRKPFESRSSSLKRTTRMDAGDSTSRLWVTGKKGQRLGSSQRALKICLRIFLVKQIVSGHQLLPFTLSRGSHLSSISLAAKAHAIPLPIREAAECPGTAAFSCRSWASQINGLSARSYGPNELQNSDAMALDLRGQTECVS